MLRYVAAIWCVVATMEVDAAIIAQPMITLAPMVFPRQASSSVSGAADPQFIGYSASPISGGGGK